MPELQPITSTNDVIEYISWILATILLGIAVRARHSGWGGPGLGWLMAALGLYIASVAPTAILEFDRTVEAHTFGFRVVAAAVVLTPWAMARYVRSATGTTLTLSRVADGIVALTVAWILLMPTLPGVLYEPRPWWFEVVPLIGFAAFAALVTSTVQVVRRATRGQSRMERRRGSVIVVAMTSFAMAYIVWVIAPTDAITAVSNTLVMITVGLLFAAGMVPRRLLRAMDMGSAGPTVEAMEHLLSTEDLPDRLPRVLQIVADARGLSGLAAFDQDGALVACTGTCSLAPGAPRRCREVRVDAGGLQLVGWANPFAPQLWESDLRVLRNLAQLIDHALERSRAASLEREAAESLRDANDRLRAADELKDRFISVVSHELRTPLSAITGYTELAIDPVAEADLPEVAEQLRTVMQEADRMSAIVDDLLTLSQTDQSSLDLSIGPVDIEAVVDAAVSSSGWEPATVSVHIDGSVREVESDRIRLEQVIVNLLGNAAKYGAAPVTVEVAQHGDSAARISVTDSGPGVPHALRPRLFERFTRGAPNTDVPGTGLGLAIVAELAAALGGRVWYEDPPDGGARFVVELPGAVRPTVAPTRY